MISIKYTCFTFNLTIKTESRKMKTEKKKKTESSQMYTKKWILAKVKQISKGPKTYALIIVFSNLMQEWTVPVCYLHLHWMQFILSDATGFIFFS